MGLRGVGGDGGGESHVDRQMGLNACGVGDGNGGCRWYYGVGGVVAARTMSAASALKAPMAMLLATELIVATPHAGGAGNERPERLVTGVGGTLFLVGRNPPGHGLGPQGIR